MFSTKYRGSLAPKAVSIISLFVLVAGVFPVPALATSGNSDSCSQQTAFTIDEDIEDGAELTLSESDDRVRVDFNDSDSGDDPDTSGTNNTLYEEVTITAATGYELVSVEVDVEKEDGTLGTTAYISISHDGQSVTYNPTESGVRVDKVNVTVKKVCLGFAGTSSCVAADGTYSITWTVTNPYAYRNMDVTSTNFEGDNDLSGSNFSDSSVADPSFTPDPVAANSSATTITTHDTNSGTIVQRVRADVDVRWQSSASDSLPYGGNADSATIIVQHGSPCPPPAPVDVCPNVTGLQTTTPCADTTCAADGGTWTNNQCVMPVKVNICHANGQSGNWNQLEVNQNGWDGHDGHTDDFLVDAQHPCPPVVQDPEPTEEEVCEDAGNNWIEDDCYTPEEECEVIDEGFWNGDTCEDIEECEQGQTYNSNTNECSDPEPTEAEACELAGDFWTGSACVDIAVCTGNQSYEAETNTCVNEDVPPTCAENQTLVEGQCVNNEVTGPEAPAETSAEETPKKSGKGLNKTCNNSQDDDNDGLYDMNDPGCESGTDTSEENPIGGDVLGASTSGSSCSALLTTHMRINRTNDAEEVKKLQTFLNGELGLTLEVDGVFGEETRDAVNAFQLKYEGEVLKPWGPFGLPEKTATGYVFKTTQRWINMIHCASLNLPMPELN